MQTLSKNTCRVIRVLSLVCAVLLLCNVPLWSHAQSFTVGGETTLTLSPQTPQAGREFTARVEAYSYDLPRSRISWTIGGVPETQYDGKQGITLRAPALGVPMVVSARVTEQNGATHIATETVTPSALDLIIESSTRVPGFYRGRALPSAGSSVRLIALPSLYTDKGALVDSRNIVYTWQTGERGTSGGLGQNTLATVMPLGGPLEVEVTAEAQDGGARQSIIQEITPAEPLNLFYEDNPLHGLAQNALPAAFTLIEDEISIRAEPYFVSRDIFDNAKYEWTISGESVANPNTDPQTLTLRKTGGAGSALVGFSIRNLSSLLQAAASAFTVYFEN